MGELLDCSRACAVGSGLWLRVATAPQGPQASRRCSETKCFVRPRPWTMYESFERFFDMLAFWTSWQTSLQDFSFQHDKSCVVFDAGSGSMPRTLLRPCTLLTLFLIHSMPFPNFLRALSPKPGWLDSDGSTYSQAYAQYRRRY